MRGYGGLEAGLQPASATAEASDLASLQVFIRGGCALYKSYATCVPISLVLDAIRRESDPERAKMMLQAVREHGVFYYPNPRGKDPILVLVLLLLADAYPKAMTMSNIRSTLRSLGAETKRVKKILYYYHYQKGIVEKLGWGVYRLSDDYYRLLEIFKPDWRLELQFLIEAFNNKDKDSVANYYIILSKVKQALIEMLYNGPQRVPKGPKRSQRISLYETSKNNKTITEIEQDKPNYTTEYVDKKLLEKAIESYSPILYDELKTDQNDLEKAVELIAILYSKAKRGKAYIQATTPSNLLLAIQEEAARLFGSSSILGRILDWDYGLRPIAELLSTAGLVFARRYGAVFKMRIDKDLEAYIDKVVEEWRG